MVDQARFVVWYTHIGGCGLCRLSSPFLGTRISNYHSTTTLLPLPKLPSSSLLHAWSVLGLGCCLTLAINIHTH
ncbi:hypothetical protein BDD12DRAFT_846484 [Trichophaea hybrida]|nr:hypothetical protein BDD12DRAFT_846484 [Trichophaea hybrida]